MRTRSSSLSFLSCYCSTSRYVTQDGGIGVRSRFNLRTLSMKTVRRSNCEDTHARRRARSRRSETAGNDACDAVFDGTMTRVLTYTCTLYKWDNKYNLERALSAHCKKAGQKAHVTGDRTEKRDTREITASAAQIKNR